MTKRFLAANWKMKGDLALCQAYKQEFAKISGQIEGKVDVLACPPAPYLGCLIKELDGLPEGMVRTGTQDISHIAKPGAHTGDIHPLVLKELGCSHAIVGHSERRSGWSEDNRLIGQKAANCFAHGITPILCVGESAEQRESGASESVIAGQLNEAFAECREHRSAWPEVLVAYEPFWAIGSGQAATPDIITAIHTFIRRHCHEEIGLDDGGFRILYGGSLNRSNMAEIAALGEVDGGLIGGASLDAAHFAELALAFA